VDNPFAFRLRGLAGWRADLAAAGLGALAALALPPLFVLPALLVAVPGLLALLHGAGTGRQAFRRGFWFGVAHHIVGLYWITDAILFEAREFWWLVPLAVPALAAVLALFIAVPCAVAWRAAPGLPRACALAGAWVLADIARQYALTGFPWNPWGSVWELPGVAGDIMIQPAAWVGVHGLTLATVLLAATPALGRRAIAGAGLGLALWAGAGIARLHRTLPAPPGVTVVLVQGNVAEGQRWNPALAMEIFTRYLDLTARGMAGVARGVAVWPETASPYLLDQDAGARAAILQATGGQPALVGTIRFDAAGQPRNSLVALTTGGPPVAIYDKWHLVPFGEYIPAWLPVPVKFGLPASFVAGPGPRTLLVPGLPPVGALICYEAIFPGQAVEPAHRPDWLVNITNDAWFGDSSGPRQHLAAVRMRAVEEGLPVMRAANTGISAAFDAMGHEIAGLGMNRAGVLKVNLPAPRPPTWFARFGSWSAAALALLAFLPAVVRKRIR
jgi:apolipoprotein N-acyltransferase